MRIYFLKLSNYFSELSEENDDAYARLARMYFDQYMQEVIKDV